MNKRDLRKKSAITYALNLPKVSLFDGAGAVTPTDPPETDATTVATTSRPEENAGTESTDTESTDTESTDTEPTDTESTDTEATDAEATDTESTDTEATDAEATDTEATDAEATDTEATDTEATDAEATDTEATDAEATDTEATDTESTDTEPTDTESTDTEATDTESTDTESTDTESTDTESTDTESTDETESTETESTETESTETESTETEEEAEAESEEEIETESEDVDEDAESETDELDEEGETDSEAAEGDVEIDPETGLPVVPSSDEDEATDEAIGEASTEDEVAFVQDDVEGYEEIVADLEAQGIETHVIRSTESGLNVVDAALRERTGPVNIHIISHGQDGAINLGANEITEDNSEDLTDILAQYDVGDVLLYGCDVAQTAKGTSLVNKIAKDADVNVAASNDDTGGDGDMTLEIVVGEVTTDVAAITLTEALVDQNVSIVFEGNVAVLGHNTPITTQFNNQGINLTGWRAVESGNSTGPTSWFGGPFGDRFNANDDPNGTGNWGDWAIAPQTLTTDPSIEFITPVQSVTVAITDLEGGLLNIPGNVIPDTVFRAFDSNGNQVSATVVSAAPGESNGTAGTPANSVAQFVTFTGTDISRIEFDQVGGDGFGINSIEFTRLNQDPDATDNEYTVNEGQNATGNVINNNTGDGIDSDPDDPRSALSVTGFTQPPAGQGTVTVAANGNFTYTPPNPDYNGSTSFTYTISDGNGGTDTATVDINVLPVNDAPDAINNSYSTNEDTPVSGNAITDNTGVGVDSDIDGGPLTVTGFTQPPVGEGTVTVAANGNFTYTPGSNFNGSTSFTYTISDGNGGTDTATIDIDVAAVNDGPDAVDNSYVTPEDTSSSGNLITDNTGVGVDSDLDGDSLTVTGNTQPPAGEGTVVVQPNGDYVYTPPANFNGTTSFEYTISDGNGGSDTATVTIDVTPVNDGPDAIDNSYSTNEDTAVSGNAITDNTGVGVDSDLDGDTLTVTGNTQPPAGEGTVSMAPNGDFTYTPDPNFNGTTTFEYTISDGNGGTDTATIEIDVAAVNDAPDAIDNSYVIDEDTTSTGNLINDNTGVGVDSDIDGDTLTVTGNTQPPAGEGTVVVQPNGDYVYTPPANFNGTTSFEYTISDGNGGTDTATVTIEVRPVNDDPDAEDDNNIATGDDRFCVDEDNTLSLDASQGLLTNDTDLDGDTLAVIGNTQPDVGGTLVVNADGSFDYTPPLNYNGPVTFEYTISDGNGGTDTATVTIDVKPVNDEPEAEDDNNIATGDDRFCVDEDETLSLDASQGLLTNDTDLDGDTLTVIGNTQPDVGGTLVVNADGSFDYTPPLNYNGPVTFEYTISDGNGGTDTATVTIEVKPVNDPPIATPDPDPNDTNADPDRFCVDEEGTLVLDATEGLLINDIDVDGDALTVISNTQPDVGGELIVNPDGSIEYTPPANYNGPVTFEYTVSDGNGGTATTTVTIEVKPVNDPPIANPDPDPDPNNTGADPDRFCVDEDTTLVLDASQGLLTNDIDIDGDTLTVISNTQPDVGGVLVVNPDGSIEYTPPANYFGPVSFEYTISDGNGGTATASVTIDVKPVNDPPIATPDPDPNVPGADPDRFCIDEDTTLTLSAENGLLINDTDLEGDRLTVISNTQPDVGGVLVVNPDGSIEYTPPADYFGPVTFEYTISDGNGGTDTATVTIEVKPVDEPPVIEPETPNRNIHIEFERERMDLETEVGKKELIPEQHIHELVASKEAAIQPMKNIHINLAVNGLIDELESQTSDTTGLHIVGESTLDDAIARFNPDMPETLFTDIDSHKDASQAELLLSMLEK